MNLKELLISKHGENKEFKIWKEKFPDMFRFSEEVEVIEWQPEFAIADRNPEVIDEMEFWEILAKNGLITEEEAGRRINKALNEAGYASKTAGIAFIEEKQVSFREKVPSLAVALHELGHVYFEETDPVWNNVYGGGEWLMWLIMRERIEGNEESIRKWHEMMHLAYNDKEKALERLDEYALKTGERIGIDFSDMREIETFQLGEKMKRPIYALMLMAGTLPSTGEVQPILVNILSGTQYGEYLYKELLKEITGGSQQLRSNTQ